MTQSEPIDILFPLTGTTGKFLVAVVRAGGRGAASDVLARSSGLSSSAALRAQRALIEAGLVTVSETGHVHFDKNAPQADVVLAMLRLAATGSLRTVDDDLAGHSQHDPTPKLSVTDLWLRDLMPAETIARNARDTADLSGADDEGPTVLEARATEAKMQDLLPRLQHFEATYQTAYQLFSNDRDRSRIHEVLHIGSGVHQGLRALDTENESDPRRGRVSSLAWAHATFAVIGEARILERVAAYATEAAARSSRRVQLVADIASETDSLSGWNAMGDRVANTATRDLLAQKLQDHRDELATIDAEGPTPDGDGERALAAAVHLVYPAVATLAQAMTAHQAFRAWIDARPAVLDSFPLIDSTKLRN